jgi:putative transposase
VRSRYTFIDGEKANYPLVSMCRWSGVSRSGFYEWRGRPASATARRPFWLAVQVVKAFRAARGTYGYRRVHAALAKRGIEAGPRGGT